MSASSKKLLTAIRKSEGRDWQQPTADYLKGKKLSARQKEALGLQVYRIAFEHAVANLAISAEEEKALAAIRDYFKIGEKAIAELRRGYAPKALQMMLDWFLIDQILTPSEEARLFVFGEQMAMTPEEIHALIDPSVANDSKKRPKPPKSATDAGISL